MRALSAAALAAVNAVITSPGHLVELALTPTPARWSDVGQVTLSDGRTFAEMDMKVGGVQFPGDAKPAQFTVQLANLDSAVGALLLSNDLSAVPLNVYGFDRGAVNVADVLTLGAFNITQCQIGIDVASLTCAPLFYTVPFRRIDPANGFNFAAAAGTQITWGHERLILERLNDWYYPNG